MNSTTRRFGLRDRRITTLLTSGVICALLVSVMAILFPPPKASAALPTGFTDVTAFTGLEQPTSVQFAPDGRIFVAEKRGTVQMFDGLSDTTPTRVADLRTEVYNYWDRGLLGLEVDPAFPARPYIYVLYTFDGPVGGTAPTWGAPGADSDPCPDPPGATSNGCVASGKLARLTLSGATTIKQDLVHDWCGQFPSHTVGDLAFGVDGALYASGGDGASFEFADFGQADNPCGDPPGSAGTALTAPTAEGGALRAQDLRSPADPTTLSGTVIRVDPDTGAALSDNPAAGSANANAARIVAHGLRNPFRIASRPGTGELWLGDVGWDRWEELNRLSAPTAGVTNLGWPCFEGNGRQGAYDAADLTMCENLYAGASSDTKPVFAYQHGLPVDDADEGCQLTRGSSTSGITFGPGNVGNYPAEYRDALYFADYSRNCIWMMDVGADGTPSTPTARAFAAGAAGPVHISFSPQGDLFYVDLSGGSIHRIVYGQGPATCPTGQYRAEYFANRTLTGPAVASQCEAAALQHEWGFEGPAGTTADDFSARWTGRFDFPVAGTYDFTAEADDGVRVWVDGQLLIDEWRDQGPTPFTESLRLSAGTHEVRVQYYEATGWAVTRVTWDAGAGNAPPVPVISTPGDDLRWRVGDAISFSGGATDPEDGTLPPSALSWQMGIQHCPDDCHSHPLQTWPGVAGASIAAPDHEYPTHLVLTLTATDSDGNIASVEKRLDPRTVEITAASSPPGLQLTMGQHTAPAPFTRTVIVGATVSLSAASSQTQAGASYSFTSWSDGGAATHNVVAGEANASYTATYTQAGTTCPAGQFRAEYFGNVTLGGTPVVGCEAAPLPHEWGASGPAGVPVDRFSARWTGSFSFATAGTYTFTARADDGVRVWVDGVLVIDQWRDQGPTTFTAARALTAGAHEVKMEYYENTGGATALLSWAAASGGGGTTCPAGQFRAEYFGNVTLGGTPVVGCEAAPLPHEWGASAPAGVPVDRFSARWTGSFSFATAGTYTFTARADDGVRVWVDGVLVIDQWRDQGPTTFTAARALTAGAHEVKMEYYENTGGATALLSWAAASGGGGTTCPAGQFRAEYFGNVTLGGTPVVGCEAAPLPHEWGASAPAGVPVDRFSARWTGSFSFATAGTYTFTARADDGVRVWVDGVLVIDQWRDQGPTTFTAARALTAGAHEVKMEYYENTGGATALLSWAAAA